jgi:hypothetical protein
MDVASLFPSLTGWMAGAPANHPLRQIIGAVRPSDNSQSVGFVILTAFNDIISALESVRPARLPTERQDFQQARTFDDLLIVRAELVAAARLARAGVPFDFGVRGKAPQPGLVLRNSNLAIEVKAGRLDGLQDLHDELEAELAAIDADVTVHIACEERPLYIKPAERRRIIDQALDNVTGNPGGILSMTLDQPWAATKRLPLVLQIFPQPPFLAGQRVFIEGGWALAEHLPDAEAEIIAILTDEQKVGQAASMPTILLVDIARAGLSWIRPERIWAQLLAARLPDDTSFIGVAVMVSRIDNPTVDFALAMRANVPERSSADARNLARALGLT